MATHFNECLTIYNTYLLPDKIRHLKKDFSKLETEFLNPGFDAEIDDMRDQINTNRNYLMAVANYFSSLLTGRSKPVELGMIKHKKEKRRGPNSMIEIYCLSTTKASGDRIVRTLRERGDTQFGDLSLEYYGSHCQIRSPNIDTTLTNLIKCQRTNQELFAKWYRQIVLWFQERSSFLDSLILLIATLDFSHSAAASAKQYRYCRPIIRSGNNSESPGFRPPTPAEGNQLARGRPVRDGVTKESEEASKKTSQQDSQKPSEIASSTASYLSLTEMRHPLKERIDNSPYITNDIFINNDCRGAMIEGVNASGKTLLIKTVVNIVTMAQMGLFVPAKEMIYYPYDIIVTRLKGDDDMFRGKSSFDVEVEELDTCLRNKGKRTLVVADELCKGTETHSALSLSAATLLELLESETSFLFATHLHDLSNKDLFPEIANRRDLQFFHLSSFHDKEKNIMVYEYKLRPGPSISIYGLEVARSKGLDSKFLDRAEMFRKRLAGIGEHLLSLNRSKYNSKVFKDKCSFCGSTKDLHDHHIIPQKQADSEGFVGHFHKNESFNQIILCQKCHIAIHAGKLTFSRIQTNDGKIDNFQMA
jgi:DNA mismatch repair ATPase MutS